MKIEISNLAHRLIVASPSSQRKISLIGCGEFTWTILIVGVTNHISGTAKARVVRFCVQVLYQSPAY